MKVKLLARTSGVDVLENKTPEEISSYIARVSNPKNQLNFSTSDKLLGYCIKEKHWSVFEHAYMSVEIETTLPITNQLLRHKSFVFQQYSGRYSQMLDYELQEARGQDSKNRQNSLENISLEDQTWFQKAQEHITNLSFNYYQQALDRGVAKESARFLLTQNTKTTIIMTGNCRSWIHYLQLRTDKSTQKEHRLIAEEIKKIFCEEFPAIAKALDWIK